MSSLDWNSVGGWAAVTLLLTLALVVPGYALLLYVPPLVERFGSFVERAIAALCLSVLLTPIFFLAMRLLALPIGGPLLVALQLACMAAIALKLRRRTVRRQGGINPVPSEILPAPMGTTSRQGEINPAPAEARPPSDAIPHSPFTIHHSQLANHSPLIAFTLFAIFLIGLIVRVHQAWGEPAALGSDGYHHTLISQLIIEQQGIPHNYLPYAPLTSFTYHYGFHALVAISYWLGGWVMFGVGALTTAKLTLMVGQILNAFAPFAVYLLAANWLGSRVAGVVAALVTLLSIFPTYYLNWGRDTQMAGLLGLPVLLLVTTMLLDAPPTTPTVGGINPLPTHDGADLTLGGINPPPTEASPVVEGGFIPPNPAATVRGYLAGGRVQGLMLLTGAAAAGLLLDHYRIIIVYAYFVAIYWLVRVIGSLTQRTVRNPHFAFYILHSTIGVSVRLAAVGLLALLIASPWLLNLLSGFSFTLQTGSKIPPAAFFSTRLSDIVDGWWWSAPLWKPGATSGLISLLPLLTSPLIILSGIGWVFGILYRNRYVISTGLLTSTLLLLSSPYFVNVPLLSGRVDYQTVASLLWLPQAVLIGYLAVAAMRLATQMRRTPSPNLPRRGRSMEIGAAALAVVIALLAALPLWDARERDPLESYLMPADLPALAWAQQHTAPHSLFLTNTFTWSWSPNSRTGSDGGLWLPLLAGGGRTATAPPLPYNNEQALDPAYRMVVTTTSVAAAHVDQQQAVDYLRSLGVKYAYIGARGDNPALAPTNQSSNPDLAAARDKGVIISGNLDPAQFQRAAQWWRQIYAHDGVYIFELK